MEGLCPGFNNEQHGPLMDAIRLSGPIPLTIIMEQAYETDPELIRLESLARVHQICAREVTAGTGREGFIQKIATGLMPRAQVSADEARAIWDEYDGSTIEMTLQFNLFIIEEGVKKREEQIEFVRNFGVLLALSPVNPQNVDASRYLQLLVPPGHRVLVNTPIIGRKLVWENNGDDQVEVNEDRYWPFCVTYDLDHDNASLLRAADAVTGWNVATTLISAEHANSLADGIVGRLLPVRDIVAVGVNTLSVTFNIAAANREEWLEKCRELKTMLKNSGVKHEPFRYNSLAYLPHEYFGQRVVYLSP